ncbi:MAG: PD40 domain-containing protein [Saprospiraceae bacterium]|nr:PD40 domain-containing protein [Saprospiraceae bacterium]
MWKILWLCIVLLPASLFAQEAVTRKTANPKALKAFEKALESSKADNRADAFKQVEGALKESPGFVDALLLRAAMRFDLGDLPAAEADFKKALGLAPNYDARAWYQLGICLLRQEKFGEAAPAFERFLQSDNRSESLRQRAGRYAADARFAAVAIQNPVPFDPEPLSDSINTPMPESLPSLTADGGMLVFTRIVDRQEDFYYSLRLPDGEWAKAQPVEGINTPFNEGAQSISADGRTLVFNACNTPDGLGSCDLYISYLKNGRWSRPQNLGEPVNTKWLERQPNLSADGKVIVFSSDRPGGHGGRDLWLTRLQPDDRWSTPVNLGSVINTAGNEDCPFFHADGQTLYFMSDGHPGMGGFDLFLSRIQPDGRPGAPENLGYPINTPANEGALIVSLDGTTAYFTSDARDARAKPGDNPAGINTDLFFFAMPPHLRPEPVTYVKAVVRDAHSRRPLQAKADLFSLPDDRLLQSDRIGEDGSFLYCLPAGRNYALHVSHEGYLFHSEHFQLDTSGTPDQPFVLDIALSPVSAPGETPAGAAPVVLHNIFFNTGSAQLLPASKAELERLLAFLNEHPALRIQINGHTDSVGADETNQLLSEQRAKAVHDYLLSGGIAPERLRYKGFGESSPMDTNDTPEGRRKNRRTEFVLF